MDSVTTSLHASISWARRSFILSAQQPPRQRPCGPQLYPPWLHANPIIVVNRIRFIPIMLVA